MTEDQQKLEFQAGLSGVLPKLAYATDNEKRLALSGFESKFFDTYEITLEDGEKQVIEKSTGKVLRDKLLHYRTPGDVVQEFAQSMLKLSKDATSKGINNGLPSINSIEDLDAWLSEKYGDSYGGKDWADERIRLRGEMGV